MHCPFCRHPDSRVIDSRETDEGQAIRRRRSCPECGRRFTTVETAVLAVVKRSGVTEPFSREKVVSGVRRACQGRQVDDDALNLLAQQVEDTVRAAGSPEVASHDVGLAILGPLRELDEVAYLRFASVYRSFSSADDFERVKWNNCTGTNCLTPKGFTLARVRLAEGVYVDLYNAHPNADDTDDALAARRANIAQLSAFIQANSAGNAVIVMGDTNTRYTRTGDSIRIDVEARVIETDADLSVRDAAKWQASSEATGAYAKYARLVGSASHGAVTSGA